MLLYGTSQNTSVYFDKLNTKFSSSLISDTVCDDSTHSTPGSLRESPRPVYLQLHWRHLFISRRQEKRKTKILYTKVVPYP